jgi:hypothetical protein
MSKVRVDISIGMVPGVAAGDLRKRRPTGGIISILSGIG